MSRSIRPVFLCSLLLTFASCSSSQKASLSDTKLPATILAQATEKTKTPPKLSFAFSSSGIGEKPADAIQVDSNRHMNFKTQTKTTKGTWKPVEGMAILEQPDYDQFAKIIFEGKLLDVDPGDVATSCTTGELYTLTLGSTDRSKPEHFDYSTCALEYNLLTEPQRSGLSKLVAWFEQLRVKYRPSQPEN